MRCLNVYKEWSKGLVSALNCFMIHDENDVGISLSSRVAAAKLSDFSCKQKERIHLDKSE